MADGSIGDKEKVQILLAEYTSLRSEINARVTSSYQVTAIASVLIVWLLQQPTGTRLWIGATIAVLGILSAAWFVAKDCINAAIRVQEIEMEINRRADEKLLIWECERGGLAAGQWQWKLLWKIVTRQKLSLTSER